MVSSIYRKETMPHKTRILLIGILLIAIGISTFWIKRSNARSPQALHHAVFLTNGQVYFGNLSNTTGQFLQLKQAYYVQNASTLNSPDATDKRKITLQRVTDEAHQPNNTVYLNRENVLYYETINANSKINEAVQKFLSGTVTPSATPSP